jgi:hypothetical protein
MNLKYAIAVNSLNYYILVIAYCLLKIDNNSL